MAQKFAPYIGRDADVIIGDQSTGQHFEAQVTKVSIAPEVDTITSKAVEKGAIYQDVSDPTWALTLEGLQGRYIGDPDPQGTAKKEFSKFAFENHGKHLQFTVRPSAADLTEGMTGVCVINATEYGFEQGAHSTFSVTLPMDGNPSYLDGTAFGSAA